MASGTVQVWSHSRGSGWIRPDSGGARVYVHRSGLEATPDGSSAQLESGQRVEYQMGQRPKGSAAINVRLLADDPAADAEAPAES
jgi:cold shock CspA family protein